MRDRLPLLAFAMALLLGALGWVVTRQSARGEFADPLSTYRSAPDGARALFLLAKQAGLPVERRHLDLKQIDGAPLMVLLGPEGDGAPLMQYVNDRPYAASSFLAVAIGHAFSTALGGRSRIPAEMTSAAGPAGIPVRLKSRASSRTQPL